MVRILQMKFNRYKFKVLKFLKLFHEMKVTFGINIIMINLETTLVYVYLFLKRQNMLSQRKVFQYENDLSLRFTNNEL